jgi:hypothetical protein
MNLVGCKKQLLALVAAVEVVKCIVRSCSKSEEVDEVPTLNARGRVGRSEIAEKNYCREFAIDQSRRKCTELLWDRKGEDWKFTATSGKGTVLRHRYSLSDRTDHAAMIVLTEYY